MNDPYVYPGTTTLRNRFDLRDEVALEKAERWNVAMRLTEGCPTGNFDVAHLKAIHRHLFQDVYPWAGEVRTVQLAKGDSAFIPARFIESGMADIHARLKSRGFLQGMDRQSFVTEAATIIGDVNHLHPFREGNGRTQMQYLQQLAHQAGHPLDVRRIEPEQWIDASISANRGDYSGMTRALQQSVATRECSPDSRQRRLGERSKLSPDRER